jgi:hypothetical protein
MKKIILLLLITTLTISCNHNSETLYKGTVVDKHYVDPSVGYKSSQEEQYQIYMREDVTQKVIKVNTNVPTYYNLEKGSRVAFKLSNVDMYALGNTSDPSLNLYGK